MIKALKPLKACAKFLKPKTFSKFPFYSLKQLSVNTDEGIPWWSQLLWMVLALTQALTNVEPCIC